MIVNPKIGTLVHVRATRDQLYREMSFGDADIIRFNTSSTFRVVEPRDRISTYIWDTAHEGDKSYRWWVLNKCLYAHEISVPRRRRGTR